MREVNTRKLRWWKSKISGQIDDQQKSKFLPLKFLAIALAVCVCHSTLECRIIKVATILPDDRTQTTHTYLRCHMVTLKLRIWGDTPCIVYKRIEIAANGI